jgi:hypothetical protein
VFKELDADGNGKIQGKEELREGLKVPGSPRRSRRRSQYEGDADHRAAGGCSG